ncbi:MAG TPA: right-handed parallel beta-helix repeat-containing protein, partial [Phycisphaerae bacterium]|nr:right-handed parallel beta-helix repeat-containing protein [Phycisphaerae bacterium]
MNSSLILVNGDTFELTAGNVGRFSTTPSPISVNARNTPGDRESFFCISHPGHYQLAGDVVGVTGKHGIKIACSGVTLDLGQSRLVGAPESLDGIHAGRSTIRNVTIRDGTVLRWGGHGVYLVGEGHRVEQLRAVHNGQHGVFVESGAVSDCVCSMNRNNGVLALAASCVAGCTANSNGGYGVSVAGDSSLSKCTAAGNHAGFHVVRSSAVECFAVRNQFHGFVTSRADLTGCIASF